MVSLVVLRGMESVDGDGYVGGWLRRLLVGDMWKRRKIRRAANHIRKDWKMSNLGLGVGCDLHRNVGEELFHIMHSYSTTGL
jgi:hypothetical protein